MITLPSQPPVLPIRTSRLHRPLIAVSLTMAFLSLIGIGGALLDDRDLLGAPI